MHILTNDICSLSQPNIQVENQNGRVSEWTIFQAFKFLNLILRGAAPLEIRCIYASWGAARNAARKRYVCFHRAEMLFYSQQIFFFFLKGTREMFPTPSKIQLLPQAPTSTKGFQTAETKTRSEWCILSLNVSVSFSNLKNILLCVTLHTRLYLMHSKTQCPFKIVLQNFIQTTNIVWTRKERKTAKCLLALTQKCVLFSALKLH